MTAGNRRIRLLNTFRSHAVPGQRTQGSLPAAGNVRTHLDDLEGLHCRTSEHAAAGRLAMCTAETGRVL